MKNKEFIFGEKRFVFDGPLDAKNPPEGTVLVAPAEAGPKAPDLSRAAGEAVVRRETGQGLAESKTKMNLNELETQLGADVFKEFLTATNLEGADFALEVFSDDVNFESTSLVNGLSGRIEHEMAKKTGLEKFATYINVKPEDMEDVVTEIYVRTFLNGVKTEFDQKYPGFADFIKEVKPNKFPINFTIKPDKDGKAVISFSVLKEEAKYQEWKVKKGITDTKKPEEGAKGQDSAAGKEQEAAIAEFAQTKLGKAFGFLKDENGKSLLQRMAEGGGLFGAIVAGIFGFSKASGGVWESIVGMLPPGIKEKALAIQERARKTPLSAEASSAGADGAQENMDSAHFREIAAKGSVSLEKGIKLTEDYVVSAGGKKGLQISLSSNRGGKMILPEESSVVMDGKTVKVEKGKTRTYDSNDTASAFLSITGRIPKGTIFQGDIAFNAAGADGGGAQKVSEKPKTPKEEGSSKTAHSDGDKTEA